MYFLYVRIVNSTLGLGNPLTFKSEISELVQAGLTRTTTTKSTRLRRALVSTVDVVEVEKEDISSEDWR